MMMAPDALPAPCLDISFIMRASLVFCAWARAKRGAQGAPRLSAIAVGTEWTQRHTRKLVFLTLLARFGMAAAHFQLATCSLPTFADSTFIRAHTLCRAFAKQLPKAACIAAWTHASLCHPTGLRRPARAPSRIRHACLHLVVPWLSGKPSSQHLAAWARAQLLEY